MHKTQDLVVYKNQQGLEFYAINKSYPEEEFDGKISRKINATFFVDDRNIGGFIGWTAVHKLLLNYEPEIKKKKGFFSFLK